MTKITPFRRFAILLFAGILACFELVVAFGQQSDTKPADDLFLSFYLDPRPERLEGFIEKWQSSSSGDKWDAYPPLAGFLAIVFRSRPDWIEKLVPSTLSRKAATTVITALGLAGNPDIPADLRSRILAGGIDDTLNVAFSGLPNRIEDLNITTPTHLDIAWGAAFASGDKQYVRMIIDFMAKTANQSEPMAIDVAKGTLAHMGGPKDIWNTARSKYGEDGARQLVYASVALWALTVNSKRYTFVRETVDEYIADHPGTPATKALSALQHIK